MSSDSGSGEERKMEPVEADAAAAVEEEKDDDDELDEEEEEEQKTEILEEEEIGKPGFNIDEIPLPHILLFLPWIQAELPKEKLLRFWETLGLTEEQRDELIESLAIKDGDEHVKDIFQAYHKIFTADLKVAQRIAKWFIQETNNEMAKRMLFDKMDPKAFHVYKKEFIENPTRPDILPKLAAHLPILQLAADIRSHVSDQKYKEISECAKEMYQTTSLLKMWRARCYFLINFISVKPSTRKHENWLYEFILACSHHPRTRPYVYYFDKDYKSRLEEYQIKLAAESAAPAQFTADLVSDEGPKIARPQSEFGKTPSHVSGETSMSNYNLYKYQEELAGQAKEGKNCIICAPTGSGKTLVAVDIIADHLRKKRMLKQVGRAVMFVPTIPLVEQQSNYINEKIGSEYFITKMSGDERTRTANDRLIDIMAGDIIVMTPQIFINMLSSPLKSQKIYLSDFTLMVFDECHHCNESHPYNVVMDNVRNAEKEIRPQIVGLTASTGSGKAKGGKINPEDTLNHIIALCARLMAVTISSVKIKKNVEDLLSRISQPVDDFIAVPPPSLDRFAHEIALICDFIEEQMKPDLKALQKVLLTLTDDQLNLPKEDDSQRGRNENRLANGSSKTTVSYYSKLAWIKNEVQKKFHGMRDLRFYVLKCLALLDMLYYALKYNELFPADLAIKYLEARLKEFDSEELYKGKENQCVLSEEKLADLRQLFDIVRDRVNETKQYMYDSENKPILTKLIQILQDEKPTSRIIVFVDMRKVGTDLSQYLSNRPEIIEAFGENKVGYIASTNQGTSKFGQTKADQEMMLEKFKEGTINILVATSVAEEGLDVAACNLVLKYNSVGSEKSLTQRKGRARAKGSKAILLALEEKTMRREFENVRKEVLMNVCIQALQVMSEHELSRRIKEKFEEMKIIAAANKQREQDRRLYSQKIYELRCKACNIIFCKSDEIFSLNNNEYICCNRDCWTGTSIKRRGYKERGSSAVALQCGEWLCSCGDRRGNVIKYGGTYLPTISSASFLLQAVGGPHEELHTKNCSWDWIKNNKFTVLPVTTKELHEMAASLFTFSQEMYKEAEENANIAALEALREDKKPFRKSHHLND